MTCWRHGPRSTSAPSRAARNPPNTLNWECGRDSPDCPCSGALTNTPYVGTTNAQRPCPGYPAEDAPKFPMSRVRVDFAGDDEDYA